MNITNNPHYVCLTNPNNLYIDKITFKPAASEMTRNIQTTFLFNKICCLTNSVPYIVTSGNNQPSAFYTFIMNEVDKNPKKYNCTKKDLQEAYRDVFKACNAIGLTYKRDKKVSEYIFNNGITVFNEKYYEDVMNGRINSLLFVDGMKKMRESLNRFKDVL